MSFAMIPKELVGKVVRFEETDSSLWDDLEEGAVPEGSYTVTVKDIQTAIENIINSKATVPQLFRWLHMLFEVLDGDLLPDDLMERAIETDVLYTFPAEKEAVMLGALRILINVSRNLANGADGEGLAMDLPCLKDAREYLKCYEENKGKPEAQWQYPDFMKEAYLTYIDESGFLNKLSEQELAKYKTFLSELLKKGNETALAARAYGCYVGNKLFKQDFVRAKADLETLFQKTENPMYANSLGYIYYYGRCNGGIADYTKAFQYFTYGAANGVEESIYKLSDMYKNGYGTFKSEKTAYRLIDQQFDRLKKLYEQGEDQDNKLADVALRMGTMDLEGIGTFKEPFSAVSELLIAQYVMKKRKQYGDNLVAARINKTLAKGRETINRMDPGEEVWDLPFEIFSEYFQPGYHYAWKGRQLKNGMLSLQFTRTKLLDPDEPANVFLVDTPRGRCELTNVLKCHVMPIEPDAPARGEADYAVYDADMPPEVRLYNDGELLMRLEGETLKWK